MAVRYSHKDQTGDTEYNGDIIHIIYYIIINNVTIFSTCTECLAGRLPSLEIPPPL